jgi:hypothetical protein
METIGNAKALLEVETSELVELEGDLLEQLKNLADLFEFNSPIYFNKTNIAFVDPQVFQYLKEKYKKLEHLISVDLPTFNSSLFVCRYTNVHELDVLLNS